MAVAAADLLSPTGDLLPEFFPTDSAAALTQRIDAYLAEGATKAAAVEDADAQDAAVRQWGYYRAYGAVYVRLLHAPASVAVEGEASTSRLESQILAFRTLRDEALATFQAIVATATEPEQAAPQAPISDVTQLGVTW